MSHFSREIRSVIVGQVTIAENGYGITQVCRLRLEDAGGAVFNSSQHFPEVTHKLTDISMVVR